MSTSETKTTTSNSNGNTDKDTAKPKQTVAVFPDIENAEAPIQLSRETTHSNHHIFIGPDNLTLRGTKGYTQAKANNGVTQGRWFYEVELKHMGPMDNARIGWSMISSLLTGPCGFDLFSYSYRARSGMLYHESRPRSPATADALDKFLQGYGPEDVLGVEIYLPKPTDDQHAVLESRVWRPKARSTYEPFKVPLPLPKAGSQSHIRYYVNGELLGTAFSDLYLGKYHPAFSLFRDAEAKVNFGPEFRYPPSHLVTESEFPLIPIPTLVASVPSTMATAASSVVSDFPKDRASSPLLNSIPSVPSTIAPHPASFSSSSYPPSTASANGALATHGSSNAPSTPSRAPPPTPLTLLPEPDRPELASHRQHAWDLMHTHGRVFPYYRVRDITPGKHYVDKSGSRVTKIQVTSPTSPFRSAAATKPMSDLVDGPISPAAATDTTAVAATPSHLLSPMSPIGSSKRRRTMGGGSAVMLSPTLGGVQSLGPAHVPDLALALTVLTSEVVDMEVGKVEAVMEAGPSVDEDVEMPDLDEVEGGNGDGGEGVGDVGWSDSCARDSVLP